jgi:hypothetical protein
VSGLTGSTPSRKLTWSQTEESLQISRFGPFPAVTENLGDTRKPVGQSTLYTPATFVIGDSMTTSTLRNYDEKMDPAFRSVDKK